MTLLELIRAGGARGSMRTWILAVILIVLLGIPALYSIPTEQENDDPRIAYVVPTFTYTAYADNGFYEGYRAYHNKTLVFDQLYPYFTPQYQEIIKDIDYTIADDLNATMITSIDIHRDNISQYDILVFQHEEYVTEQMYLNYIDFVDSGGKVLFLDGNMFFAEITFNGSHIQLIEGHDFRKVSERKYSHGKWDRFLSTNLYNNENDDMDNLGSFETPQDNWSYDYLVSTYRASIYDEGIIRANISNSHALSSKLDNFQYQSHEENTVINPNVDIIFTTNIENPDMGICAYTYGWGSGEILYTGMYASYIFDSVFNVILIYLNYLLSN